MLRDAALHVTVFIFALATGVPPFAPLTAFADDNAPPPPNWAYVEKKLKAAGFKPRFLKALRKMYQPADFRSVLDLNCLLFLRKSDYHTTQVTDQAVEDVKRFMTEHKKALESARKKYGVDPSVISGLLWLESRYGQNLGRYHVASSFVDLVQADRPQVIAHLKLAASPRFTRRLSVRVARDITKKAQTKAKWAVGELKAVQEMYGRDRELVTGLRGSFAGAFGMPQFEPSSYVHYARAAKKGKTPNLTDAADAIHSVAYYLRESGWRKGKEGTYEKALLKYNNSRDYANAILQLADRAEGREPREPASLKHGVKKKAKKKKRRQKHKRKQHKNKNRE